MNDDGVSYAHSNLRPSSIFALILQFVFLHHQPFIIMSASQNQGGEAPYSSHPAGILYTRAADGSFVVAEPPPRSATGLHVTNPHPLTQASMQTAQAAVPGAVPGAPRASAQAFVAAPQLLDYQQPPPPNNHPVNLTIHNTPASYRGYSTPLNNRRAFRGGGGGRGRGRGILST
jgi:hypothetical protein